MGAQLNEIDPQKLGARLTELPGVEIHSDRGPVLDDPTAPTCFVCEKKIRLRGEYVTFQHGVGNYELPAHRMCLHGADVQRQLSIVGRYHTTIRRRLLARPPS